jgi:predicted membrane protein
MVATSGSAPEPLRKTDARPPLRHRKDSSTLLSLLLVTVGLAWLFSETGIYTVSLEAVLAVCLAIVGVAMVITARTDWSLSRKHWPMWLGIGLLVVLLASTDGSAIGSGLASLHFGPIDTAPTSWASATYSNLAGPLDVDLSHLPAGPDAKTIRVQNTFGPIRVTLPAAPKGYQIDVDARTTFGPVTVPGQATSAGTFSHQTYATQGRGPVLHVDVRDSFGPVIVQTAVPSS